jgi:hypothetical protein
VLPASVLNVVSGCQAMSSVSLQVAKRVGSINTIQHNTTITVASAETYIVSSGKHSSSSAMKALNGDVIGALYRISQGSIW